MALATKKRTDIPEFPTYKPYGVEAPMPFGGYVPGKFGTRVPVTEPKMPTMAGFPEIGAMPTYEPTAERYPTMELPTYEPTAEAYPEYIRPEAEVAGALGETIQERMAGRGTAGAESAIYERGQERVEREAEEGLRRIDEQMAARGLTGSGIHGEAVEKLETEKQRSLADLSRQVTIYGQQAIESAMAQGQQYVAYQSAEVARELSAKERGWAGRVGESIRRFESEAKAAEAKGMSEQAAYQIAVVERTKAYESQARAATAKTQAQITKWQAETQAHMQKYQLELQKAQMLQQAKMTAWQVGREEYRRAYESEYAATRDTWVAQQAAEEAARRRVQEEWTREKERIEQQMKRREAAQATLERQMEGFGQYTGQWTTQQTPTRGVGAGTYLGGGYGAPAPQFPGTPVAEPTVGRYNRPPYYGGGEPAGFAPGI